MRGQITLTVQSSLVGRATFGVRARVDGQPFRVRHGDNVLPVAAGRHTVECSMVLAGEYGRAAIEVTVPVDGQAQVFYAPPFNYGIAGRIGTVPQRPAGTWWMVLLGAVLVLGLAYTLLT